MRNRKLQNGYLPMFFLKVVASSAVYVTLYTIFATFTKF